MRISRRGIWQVGVAHNRRGRGGGAGGKGGEGEADDKEGREDCGKGRARGGERRPKRNAEEGKHAHGSKTQQLTLELGPDLSRTSLDLAPLAALTAGFTNE